MDTESISRYHVDEARDRLFMFIGEIVCRRRLCDFCRERMDAALKVAGDGPEAFLTTIRDHQGIICGCAQSMKELAADAIGWSNVKPINPERASYKPFFVLEKRFKPGWYLEWWGDECGGPYWTNNLAKAEKLTMDRAEYEKGMLSEETLIIAHDPP